MDAPAKRTRGRKRGLKIAVVVLAVLFLLVLSLPWLASTTAARNAILRAVNRNVDGEVSVGDWSFRWLGNQEVRDFRFRDGDGRVLASVPALRIEKGLLALVHANNRLGRVVVTEPAV
jgi:autotransporter translocation and assembly factor TamB